MFQRKTLFSFLISHLDEMWKIVYQANYMSQFEVCVQNLWKNLGLRNHVRVIQELIKPKRATFLISNKEFSMKRVLKNQVDAVHDKKRPFVCYLCDSNFAQPIQLKEHLKDRKNCVT